MPVTRLENLTQARDLIADKAKWTRYFMARDEEGKTISWTDPKATCFCALGALCKTGDITNIGKDGLPPGHALLEEVARTRYGNDVAWVNDNKGHEAILEVYDRCIEIARAS